MYSNNASLVCCQFLLRYALKYMYMYVYNTICGFDSLFIVLLILLLFFVFVSWGVGVLSLFCNAVLNIFLIWQSACLERERERVYPVSKIILYK